MEQTQNYLQVLSESLDRKIVILDELSRITESQKNIAMAENFDDEEYNRTVNEKDSLINELERLDKGFQTLYDNIKSQLDTGREKYRDEIKTLQVKIKQVLDKSAALQVAEENNRRLVTNKLSSMRKEMRQVRKTRNLAAYYYKSMNNISENPVFLDQKK